MPIDPVIDASLRRLRRQQHAAAHRDQLIAAGVTRAQIATRVHRGEWQRPFRSVYILGDPGLIPLAIASAVLLCLGEDAILNDRIAGFLWGQIDYRPPVIDVAVPRTRVRPRPGVRIHLIQPLNARDVRYQHGLRLTGPARTLIDLATHATSSELEHITSESVAKRLITEQNLIEALDRAPHNHPGAARLRARLRDHTDLLLHTRSVAERIAYPLIRDAGLPRPGLNEIVEGQRVDMHWPQHRLIAPTHHRALPRHRHHRTSARTRRTGRPGGVNPRRASPAAILGRCLCAIRTPSTPFSSRRPSRSC